MQPLVQEEPITHFIQAKSRLFTAHWLPGSPPKTRACSRLVLRSLLTLPPLLRLSNHLNHCAKPFGSRCNSCARPGRDCLRLLSAARLADTSALYRGLCGLSTPPKTPAACSESSIASVPDMKPSCFVPAAFHARCPLNVKLESSQWIRRLLTQRDALCSPR